MQYNNWSKAEKVLKNGGVIVAPTDTLYGILAKALDKKSVERVYEIKGRDDKKPLIVLITEFSNLKKFHISLNEKQKEFLDKVWPGKVSVVLPCKDIGFAYLHRGTRSIAFRMVGKRNINIFNLVKNSGPLVAPSANPQGLAPSVTIWQAKKYFGEKVDMYMCGGTRNSKPSTLVKLVDNKFIVLRKGSVKI